MKEHLIINNDNYRNNNAKNINSKRILIFTALLTIFGVLIYLITFSNLLNLIKNLKPIQEPACYNPDFDYYYFVQRWPITDCYHSVECFNNITNIWQIHGLWPNYNNHSWPEFCCIEKKFNLDELKPIVPKLELFWRNLIRKDTYSSLWEHEYTKHGTCSLKDFPKQFEYFNSTLTKYFNYNLTKIFADNDILPSNDQEYDLQSFHDALTKVLNTKVHIECTKKHGKYFIDSVFICFNRKNLQLIDCSEPDLKCKESIYYPSSVKMN